jgi:hypothetical protein
MNAVVIYATNYATSLYASLGSVVRYPFALLLRKHLLGAG